MNAKTNATTANNYFELDGKLALVTGASSGLGWHFAHCLAKAGCNVIVAARRQDRLDKLADEINSSGGHAFPLVLDVQNRETCKSALSSMASEIGVPDILINNAGIAKVAHFLDATDSDTDAVIGVNQTGVWQVSQTVCNQMVDAGKPGAVINIASILGLSVAPGVGSYAVSKAAVVQLTNIMALELARHQIRVNAIAPGYFSTEMNHDFLNSDAGKKVIERVPSRRAGELSDLDGVLLLLASSRSQYMTGCTIPVDGGHLVAGLM